MYWLQKSEIVDTRIIHLFIKYLNEECTPDELNEVLFYLKNGKYQAEWDAVLSKDAEQMMCSDKQSALSKSEENSLYQRIERDLRNLNEDEETPLLTPERKVSLWIKYGKIAAILIVFGFGSFFYFKQHRSDTQQLAQTNDVSPGINSATLTLADGRKVILSAAANGKLAEQSGVNISKTAKGELIYEIKDNKTADKLKYNTLSTTKGEQYRIRLPDGSLVWLNAASSLKYPVSFNGNKERKVELNGEAYFEVAKNKAQPFLVTTNKQTVKVLGTHFNINAYPDEPATKTTLLEGSVQISSSSKVKTLKPGEQSALTDDKISIKEVNTEEGIAWKNGYFVFDNENIKSIMRKVSRWYNVEVVFEGDVAEKEIGGMISRYENISPVLELLKATKAINYKLEGKRVVIMPYKR